jgi:hypothetical protein
MNADGEEDDDGRADPARSAHFPAEWRCGWGVEEKRKSDWLLVIRYWGKRVGRGRPRRADFPAEWRCWCAAEEKRKNSLRRKKVVRADRAGSALPGDNGRAWSASPRRLVASGVRCGREAGWDVAFQSKIHNRRSSTVNRVQLS